MKHATTGSLGMIAVIIGLVSLAACTFKRSDSKTTAPLTPTLPSQPEDRRVEARLSAGVSALGTLEPEGDVHVLAGPVLQMGGAPRVRSILVREGQRVSQGQLVATFDNFDNVRSERNRVLANISSKKAEINVLESETNRYRKLQLQGAFSSADLEARELKLLDLKSQLKELQAILKEVNVKAEDTELRTPITGYILRLTARVGERPDNEGVMEIGNSDRMEAVLQVDESDIKKVRIGQLVNVTSENQSFTGELSGRVSLIGVRVSSRKRFSVDPTIDTDAEARVIDVRVSLIPQDSRRVRDLVGAKVLGRFQS